MSNIMTKEIAERYSKFTTDEDLTLDDFIVFEDIDVEHITMMNRYNTLLNKSYTTDAEKAEMTTLLTQLESYMPTSDIWNKLCACMLNMQMFIRDGIVIFIKEKQEEINSILSNYEYKGTWNSITNYSIGNGVSNSGFGFLSIADNNIGNEPNAEVPSDEYWIRYTIKGDKGDPSLNVNYKGDYISTTTYNLGDACTYNSIMYYAKINGVLGILPTDQTKWAYVNNVVVSNIQPTDTHVIWWDTATNKFKRYTSNLKWEEQIINASNLSITDNGNLFTATNVEEALAELKIAINNINLTASNVAITDNGNYYTGTNVETVTQEIGSKLSTISGSLGMLSSLSTSNKSSLVSAINETFQYANNGKKSIANVVGTVTGSNTHAQIANEILTDKNILANNLISKGVSASANSSLKNLAGLVGNITVQSLGGRRVASGTVVSGDTMLPFAEGTSQQEYFSVIQITSHGFIPNSVILWSSVSMITICNRSTNEMFVSYNIEDSNSNYTFSWSISGANVSLTSSLIQLPVWGDGITYNYIVL